MKNHLKKNASPKSWLIRKGIGRFVIKPQPGPHPISKGLPLGLVLRDNLNIASTLGEIKKILNNNEILVDGRRRKDPEFVVGLFDVIHLSLTKKTYRIILDGKGRLSLINIELKDGEIKICKITGKKVLPKSKIQFNLHDGKSLVGNFEAKIGDSLVLSLPDLKVKEVLPLKDGVSVYLLEGKHAGDIGRFKKMVGTGAVYIKDGQEIETAKDYLFVVGKEKLLISLGQEHQKTEKNIDKVAEKTEKTGFKSEQKLVRKRKEELE